MKKLKKKKIECVDVSWEKLNVNKPSFVSKIDVTIKNEVGALGKLSTNIAENNSNIRNLKITERSDIFFKLNLEIDVANLDHLKTILVSLRTSTNIISVKRMK